MEVLITFFVFVAIMTIAAILFGGWVILGTIRLIVRGLGMLLGGSSSPSLDMTSGRTCEHHLCQAKNPGDARFCRRCGRAMSRPEQVAVRRAAMF